VRAKGGSRGRGAELPDHALVWVAAARSPIGPPLIGPPPAERHSEDERPRSSLANGGAANALQKRVRERQRAPENGGDSSGRVPEEQRQQVAAFQREREREREEQITGCRAGRCVDLKFHS